MNRLHLNKKDFWRYPLDRALLKPLLKDDTITLHYEKETKIWKLNGSALQPKSKKLYSKIAGFILYVFHKIRICFSADYRKKFKAAILKIEKARLAPEDRMPKFKEVADLFHSLDVAIRINDIIDKKELYSRIGGVLGIDEQKIDKLMLEFSKLQNHQSPKAAKIKAPTLTFEDEDEIDL